MSKINCWILISILSIIGLSACGPPRTDVYVEVKPNETAFVVPLEGNTGSQKKVMSIEYLEKRKVSSKRIYLPLKKVTTGRWWWNYKWVPTVRVITVDRRPITFEWVGDDAIKVESKDSIDFSVGVTIAAYIDEKDTARFLYYYPNADLEKVLNNEVYTKATEILSREFAKYPLKGDEQCDLKHPEKQENAFHCGGREMKGFIISQAKRELGDYFKQKGVTITAFGLVGGMKYTDPKIQEAINKNFASELEIINKRNEKLAQDEINQKMINKAKAERKAAEEFAKAAEARMKQVEVQVELLKAQALKNASERWNGQLPSNIVPENSKFLFTLPSK